jgi:MFS family permease
VSFWTAEDLTGFRQASRHSAQALLEPGSALGGGLARARVILILAAALGLQGADVATVSATANDLQRAFGINNTAIGLLVSVTALAGALGTIPIGVLTDRTRAAPSCWRSFPAFLIVLIIAGALSLTAIRSYPRDVATAAESYRRQPMMEAS